MALASLALANTGKSRSLRLVHAAVIAIGAAAILQSGSRAALMGFFFGFIVGMVYMDNLSRKVNMVPAAGLIAATAFAFLPGAMVESLKERTNLTRIQADRGANRLDIWSNYLSELPSYAGTGVGFLHSRDVIRASYTSQFAMTHN